ncbi:MAG TPA: adenylosuccinate lyase [Sphaerochaeta sp.]|nr:adenylosuccinate lyase [Sphaerochaeta sp.]
MQEYTHDTFISPFTWRYGSTEMRTLFSEVHKRKILRRIWIALARAQSTVGLVSEAQLAELVATADKIDIKRASEIEAQIHHDLMAEIKAWAEQCPNAGAIIHLGATSMDVLDNMDALRLKEALSLIIERLEALLSSLLKKMEETKALATMAFTHIQPAEVTTVGYRLAQHAQDLGEDLIQLRSVRDRIRGKGMKGAVGTAASYAELLSGTGMSTKELEDQVMAEIGLSAYSAATQVYTRKQDLFIGQALSALAATVHKLFFDFRLLQAPPMGEWSEPFAAMQVGSSAMPFKRNPIHSEKIDSLCRYVEAQITPLWYNVGNNLLERTLDDSANRRIILPGIFLASDEVLVTALRVIEGMQIHPSGIQRNLDSYAIFAATERLLMELAKKGADRQAGHEMIREQSLKAWDAVQRGKPNPLLSLLQQDPMVSEHFTAEEVAELLNADDYTGDSVMRTELVAAEIRALLKK